MPSKSELREHMLACAALRYKVGLVYHGNAAETGEYLYDPNYTPTRDIEQVVHTLSAMFKPTSVEPGGVWQRWRVAGLSPLFDAPARGRRPRR